MTMTVWGSYFLACLMLSLIPGPSVMIVTAQSLGHGLRAAMVCIAGELLGGICLVILSLLGLGAVLATSALLFQLVKWAGVAYLIYLGLQQLRRSGGATTAPATTARASFRAGFITSLLNPKSIVFYMAFLSQFIDPNAAQLPQLLQLVSASSLAAGLVLSGYALLASRARATLLSPSGRRWINRMSGGFYLGTGAVMAATR